MYRQHQTSLEQECLAQFRARSMLDPSFAIRSALSEGALEVYDYLLAMDEEDLNATLGEET